MLLIRSLYNKGEERRRENKRLHLADERFLNEAERLLHDEFSAVLGIEETEVVPFIMSRLEKADYKEPNYALFAHSKRRNAGPRLGRA